MYKKCSKTCAYSFIKATNATQKLQHRLYMYMSHTLTVPVYSCCTFHPLPPLPLPLPSPSLLPYFSSRCCQWELRASILASISWEA